jgi:hypothetical protein
MTQQGARTGDGLEAIAREAVTVLTEIHRIADTGSQWDGTHTRSLVRAMCRDALERLSRLQPSEPGTCATCVYRDVLAYRCARGVTRPGMVMADRFGCTLHEPAPPTQEPKEPRS